MKLKDRQKKYRNQVILYGVAAILFLVLLFSVIFYTRANRPMSQAQKEAEAIAQKYAKLSETDKFYWFTREQTYFSLLGKNDKGQEIAVIIPKSGDKVTLLSQKDGISELDARSMVKNTYPEENVQKAELGIYKDQPVWEVVTKNQTGELNYYLLTFKDGEEVSKIQKF